MVLKQSNLTIDGQLSIFDINIINKPKKVTETIKPDEVITKTSGLITEDNIKLTVEQKKVVDKFMQQENLLRVIIYAKGSIGVEIKELDKIKTYYLNIEGKEEFNISSKSPVMPWDRIFYFDPKVEKVKFTQIQTDKLQTLLCKFRNDIKRVINRKGDENIIIEFPEKIVSILPNGWELEFKNLNHIDCLEEEIYLVPAQTEENKEENLEEIQKRVKIGDYVQASHGKQIIEGKIVHQYGLGNQILNIIFDEGTKHTAIGRISVRKILKSA